MRRLLTLSVALLAALLVLTFVLHTTPARGFARARAEAWLREHARLSAHIGSLDYSLRRLHVEVRDVTLAPVDRPEAVFLRAGRISVDIEGFPFLAPWRLRAAGADHLHLSLRRDAQGRLNLPESRGGGDPPSVAWVVPDALDVRHLTFTYEDERASPAGGGPIVEVPDASWHARRREHGLEGIFAVEGFAALRFADRSLSATGLRSLLRWDGRSVLARDVTALLWPAAPSVAQGPVPTAPARLVPSTGTSPLTALTGTVTIAGVFESPTITAEGRGDLTLDAFERWLSLPFDLDSQGTIHWAGTVTGDVASPTVDATVSGSALSARGEDGLALTSGLRFEDGTLTVRGTRITRGASTIETTATIPTGAAPGPARVEGRWQAVPLATVLHHVGRPLPGARAWLDGNIDVTWQGSDLRSVTGAATNRVRSTGTVAEASLNGQASWRASGGRWTLRHEHTLGTLLVDGSASGPLPATAAHDIPLNGPFNVSSPDLAATLVDLAHLGILAPAAAARAQAGSMTFQGHLAGTLGRPAVAGPVSGQGLRTTLTPRPVALEANIRLDTTALDVTGGSLTQGPNEVTLQGRLAFRAGTLTGTGTLDMSDFDPLWTASDLPRRWLPRGRLTARASVSGTLRSPNAEAEFSGSMGLGALAPSPVGGRVRLVRERLFLDDVGIDTPGGRVDADGQVDLADSSGRFLARATIDLDAAERLGPLVSPDPWPLSGAWAGRATAEGRLDDLDGAAIEALFERVDGAVSGLPVALDEPAHLARQGDHVAVTRLVLRSNGTVLTLDGALGPDEPGITIGADVRLEDIAPWTSAVEATARPALAGALRLEAQVGGRLRAPRIEATLTGRELSLGADDWPPLTGASLDAHVQDGLISVRQMTGTWQGASLAATATVPIRLLERWLPRSWHGALQTVSGPARFGGALTGLTPAALQSFVSPETLATIGGRASIRVSAEADELSLDELRGEVTFDSAEFVVAQVPVKQSVPTRLVLADNRLRIDTLQWEGPGTTITGFGGLAWPQGEARLDVAIDAGVDLRMASVFVRPAATGGRADVSVSFAGPVREPLIEGRVLVTDGEFRNRDPRLAVTDVSGTLLLIGDRLTLEAVTGQVNGGALSVQGTARLDGWSLATLDLAVAAKDAAVEFPPGLRTEVVADLRLTKSMAKEAPVLKGTVTALRGSYREQMNLTAQLLGRNRGLGSAGDAETSGILGRIRLDLGLATLEDISAENNYGRVEAGAALRVGGTVDSPTLAGRISLRQGGLVFLGGNVYRLERGAIDFREGPRIEPILDVTARTQVGQYSIQLQVDGPPTAVRAELTSDPPADQSDIVSLLMTGRTVADGGLSTHVLSSQVLGYLSGDLLNAAGRVVGLDSVRLDRGVSLDELRFDPTIIASETEPESRLTISKNLTRDVDVVLSQNLETGRLTWIATWRPRRTVALRVLSLDNKDRIYEFRQELALGDAPAATGPTERTTQPRVAGVAITGADADQAALLSRLQLKTGKRFDFYRWQDDRERLLAYFQETNRYEANVASRRREVSGEGALPGVELRYEVRPGLRGHIAVEGLTPSEALLREIRAEWTRAVFDDFLVEDVTRIVRRALTRDGFLRADVTTSIEQPPPGTPGEGTKVLRVRAVPGQATATRRIEWMGHQAVDAARLDAAVERAGIADDIWQEPALLEPVVRDLFVAEGYPAPVISAGLPQFDDGAARLPVRIVEGPQARLGALTFRGTRSLEPDLLMAQAGLEGGRPLTPAALDRAQRSIETAYLQRGFVASRVGVEATATPDGTVDVVIAVDEGPQNVLQSVEIVGARHTHPGLVRRALGLEADAPLDPDALFEARRRLYETGAFRQVDVETIPVSDARVVPETGAREQPVTARVTVDEWPLWRVRYGLQVNDLFDPVDGGRDVGPGFSANLERANLLGRAATVGASFRYELERQALRGYLSAPRFFDLPISSTLFAQQEWAEPRGTTDVQADITTLSFEQRYRLQRRTQINYGAFYRRTMTSFVDEFLGPVEVLVRYAGLLSAVSFDRRDNPFDTRRGWFHASSLKYSPGQFGSDLKFVRWLTQQSFYKEVGPGLVLAWNGLLGLADGFGQDIVPDERFYAGGGSSVRGYKDDSLGPRDIFEVNIGGEALVVLNHELRFPIWNRFSGVAFLDAGNAFAEPSRIVLGELEVGTGLGLRVGTPIGLLRFDFGVPVSRGGGLGAGRLHFSFGQVF